MGVCSARGEWWNKDCFDYETIGGEMKFRIHFKINGEEDCVVITGESIKECQAKAVIEIEKRNATDAWSEEIK